MHVQPRLLSLFFFLAVFCPLAARGQSPTLNLRRGVIRSDPGVPTVQVTVDRRRVPLGTMVTFTLSPANVIRSSLYTVILYFGDDKQQSVSTTEVPHLYRAVGTYIYSVEVKSTRRPPPVTLSATPVRADRKQPVSFSAKLSWSYPNIQYRFFYGDGNSSDWQDSPTSDYAYQSSGRYSAYVDIGEGKQQLGGSPRKIIDVTDKTQPFSVALSANPNHARARQRVTFVARADPAGANTKYRFEFGDAQSTGWQTSPLATHAYPIAGNYRARVDATQSDSGQSANATSLPAVIAVQGSATPPSTPTPTPRPTPRSSPTPVSTPTSSPSPNQSPSPNNGSSPSPSPTSSGSAFSTTSPSPDGSTSTGPTGTTENGGNSSSSPGANSPGSGASSNGGAGPLGLPGNWWKYLLIAALILFLIYQVSGLLFVARPTFAAFSDPGVSALDDRLGALPIDFQLVLNRNVSAGAYGVETSEPSLVTNADRLEERQILEI